MKFDFHYFFSAKYAKWIIICLITLFLLLIVFEYITLFFFLTQKQTAPDSNTKIEIGKVSDSYKHILDSALFGVFVPDDLNEDNVKKSMLNLTLVGILLAEQPADSQVIIRNANGDEKIYKISDEIPGGAVIKRIISGGILVDRNGTLESISLPKNDLIFEPAAQPLKEEEE